MATCHCLDKMMIDGKPGAVAGEASLSRQGSSRSKVVDL